MFLQNSFINNFEIIIPEFYISLIILISILYGVFLIVRYKNEKKYILLSLINILSFFLVLVLILVLNININYSVTLLKGIFIFDELAQMVKSVVLISTIFFLQIQKKYTLDNKINTFEYLILIIISLLGLMLLISSYNLILIFLSIELQSLCFYILAGYQRKSVFSSEAALKYFIMGAIASGFILFGSSIIYMITGSLNLGDIFVILSNINEYSNLEIMTNCLFGFYLILAGLLFKIGSAPFHFWVADVYEGSSDNITAFFSIVPKIAIIGLLLRIFFDTCFNVSVFFGNIFLTFSFISILIGAFATLKQRKIKRLLAFSSIGHVGFILIAFVANTVYSIQSILFYICIYIVMTLNFWTILLSIKKNNKYLKFLTDFTNFSKINPTISIILILNLFSMAGIPPLAGFFSKMFIFYTALDEKVMALSIVGILLSIVSTFYYIRIIKIVSFDNYFQYQKFSQISYINSIILLINFQIILFIVFYMDEFLLFLKKISLSFLI